MEFGPDFLLGLAGQRLLVHARHPGFADANSPSHELKLFRALDFARMFGQFLAFHERNATLAQRVDAERFHLVDCEPHVAATMLADYRRDFVCPFL